MAAEADDAAPFGIGAQPVEGTRQGVAGIADAIPVFVALAGVANARTVVIGVGDALLAIDSAIQDQARDIGFEFAVTTAWGAGSSGADPYQIPRFTPWDRTQWAFAVRLARNLRLQEVACA